jgi:hypothetical protein
MPNPEVLTGSNLVLIRLHSNAPAGHINEHEKK